LVVDLGDTTVIGDVVDDILFIDSALRQQGAGDRGDREHEQQDQCGAHAGQPAPSFVRIRPYDAHDDVDFYSSFQVPAGLAYRHRRDNNEPQWGPGTVLDQGGAVFHGPLAHPVDEIRPSPAEQGNTHGNHQRPANHLDRAGVAAQPPDGAHRPRGAHRTRVTAGQQQNRQTQTQAVADDEYAPAQSGHTLGTGGTGDDRRQRRPQTRGPAQGEDPAKQRGTEPGGPFLRAQARIA